LKVILIAAKGTRSYKPESRFVIYRYRSVAPGLGMKIDIPVTFNGNAQLHSLKNHGLSQALTLKLGFYCDPVDRWHSKLVGVVPPDCKGGNLFAIRGLNKDGIEMNSSVTAMEGEKY